MFPRTICESDVSTNNAINKSRSQKIGAQIMLWIKSIRKSKKSPGHRPMAGQTWFASWDRKAHFLDALKASCLSNLSRTANVHIQACITHRHAYTCIYAHIHTYTTYTHIYNHIHAHTRIYTHIFFFSGEWVRPLAWWGKPLGSPHQVSVRQGHSGTKVSSFCREPLPEVNCHLRK